DGVHFGHRKILRRLRTIAAERNWKPSVLTFDPHPTRVVAPDRTPPLLTSPGQRVELMREEGIEQVLILPFTAALALPSPAGAPPGAALCADRRGGPRPRRRLQTNCADFEPSLRR